MGCFLFQLPPSFHYTPALLKKILAQLDHRRRNVVEFRHRSRWNEAIYSAFRETGTIFCSCSGPRLPDELIKTADDIYIRFHGTSNGIDMTTRKEASPAETASTGNTGSVDFSGTTCTSIPDINFPRCVTTTVRSEETCRNPIDFKEQPNVPSVAHNISGRTRNIARFMRVVYAD